jgi:hypothetical protein
MSDTRQSIVLNAFVDAVSLSSLSFEVIGPAAPSILSSLLPWVFPSLCNHFVACT